MTVQSLDRPILSLCIPTNGIVEWVVPAIESIYAQNVDNSFFEVVVTDNGKSYRLENAIRNFDYPNLYYYRSKSQGFTNQIDAFEKCSGLFCKMLNHRSRMLPGSIQKMIALIERYKDKKPIIYFAECNVKGDPIIECRSLDDFVGRLTYWLSWSAGIGAWRSDVVDVREKVINEMFPHTVFLFGLRETAEYVICNDNYQVMAGDYTKGGYNVFKEFGITFLDIFNDLRKQGKIRIETFTLVKSSIFGFLCRLYLQEVILPSRHTFQTDYAREYMRVYYGDIYYWVMWFCGWVKAPLSIVKKVIMR